jgi:hypothetical protein
MTGKRKWEQPLSAPVRFGCVGRVCCYDFRPMSFAAKHFFLGKILASSQ